MARPIGTKNIMRTPEEKQKIILEVLSGQISTKGAAESNGVSRRLLIKWINTYRSEGFDGLKSKTGRSKKPGINKSKKNQTEIERLEEALLKKEIEIMRLKKGYQVKGVGAKKEYVTTFDTNMK